MGSKANIYIDQGTDFRLSLELFDEDNDEMVLSTITFHADMRKIYSSKKAVDFDIETANNDVTLVLSADTTATLNPGKYQYDVLMKKATGETSKLLEGLATVVPTITEV